MTEFRRDPLTRRWVITGLDQNNSPEDHLRSPLKKVPPKDCQFCEGREQMTPPETYAVRKDSTQANTPGWQIRVVPNRATDLHSGELAKRSQGGLYDMQNGAGIHETVIETPQHISQFSQLSAAHISDVFKTFQLRTREHKKNQLLKGTFIFRNQGKRSAGVYDHTHSHIVSLPFVPKTIQDELSGAKWHYDLKTRCLFCDMIAEEKKLNLRVLFENDRYFSWCPFASRFPFECWIMAKQHQHDFTHADSAGFGDLAEIVKKTLTALEKTLGDCPMSFVLHTAPLRGDVTEDNSYIQPAYHWHIEILPHAWPVGGFEWGGDFFLSPPLPEKCAAILRNPDAQ